MSSEQPDPEVTLPDCTTVTIDELADALRELHDFSIVDTHHPYAKRSAEAFHRAGELLRRIGK
jgi:precorrin-6x reductase